MKLFGVPRGPNLADLSSTSSTVIAGRAYELLGIRTDRTTNFDIGSLESGKERSAAQNRPSASRLTAAGARLEEGLENDLRAGLHERDPDRGWFVTRQGNVADYAQYEHLAHLQRLFESDPTLKTAVGRDYQVSTDLMVALPNPWAVGPTRILHAAISSKLTIRSDRVQNVRVEFATLVRNRRGRLPHLVVVTAEPLPSRVVSVARGTGEIDAVYHLLFEEMDRALRALVVENPLLERQAEDWAELTTMGRVRPYSELIDVLASG